jgi:hypothetical protein
MGVLRGTTDSFNVEGRHDILTAVDLPEFLPADVVTEMVTRFVPHLLSELQKVIRNPARKVKHGPTNSMSSDVSVSSAGSRTWTPKPDDGPQPFERTAPTRLKSPGRVAR